MVLLGSGDVDAASGQDQRPLCLLQQLIGLLQLPYMYRLIWLVAADLHMGGILGASQLGLDILRDIDQHRPRFAGGGDGKCHLDDPSQILPG